MGTGFGQRWGASLALGLLLAACSGNSKTSGNNGTAGTGGTADTGGTAGTGNSTDAACMAGAKRCDGSSVKICNDDGTAESVATKCTATQSCSNGACVEEACVPNTTFCKDKAIWKCDATGSGSALSQMCAATQFCLERDESASCSDQACAANEAMCDGTVATACKIDGSGPKPGGTDCSATKQACYQGVCRDVACTGGMKVCQHDDVYLCAKNGTDMSLLADCQAGEVCDAAQGTCSKKVCDVGLIGCDSTRVTKCNAYGSAWEQAGLDCAADSKICVAGACKKQTCKPSTSFCQDGSVYQCDAAGVTSQLAQTCSLPDFHCQPYPSSNYAVCAYNSCPPNQLVCDGNVAKTCTAEGSYPVNGTDCGNNNFCELGVCKPKVCEPYQSYCKDNDIYLCNELGGPTPGSLPVNECGADAMCKVINQGASCVPLPCSPGSTACLANKIGVCAADGQSVTSPTDCITGGNVCTLDAKCQKTVTDTLGILETFESEESGVVIGDVIDVTSARKVTELQANLDLVTARELRWVIYEQTGSTYTARLDKVMSNQTGTGFISSGPLGYSLKAGKRYVLAVAISGGTSTARYDGGGIWPQTASFGNIVGRLSTYYSPTLDLYLSNDLIYQMKVVTEAP